MSSKQRSVLLLLLICGHLVLATDPQSTTTRAPSKRYPVRTFLGNMYHRFRNNRTPGMLIIPPLIRLAYQYGGPLLERMGSALGIGGQAAAASAPGLDSLVDSAISGALGGSGGAAAGGAALSQPMAGLPFAGLPPAGFGAAGPMFGGMGGVRPVFFRRRRR